MRILTTALMAALTFAGFAQAAPSAKDRAAIASMETRLTLLEGSRPGSKTKSLAARMAELNVPGVSVAFVEDGKVKWAQAYGFADASARRPVTRDTLFQAASMSKAVAAAGALVLVDQGRLDLDEDVNTHLDSWKVPHSEFTAEKKVTLRRLLSHTAGVTVSGFPGYRVGKPVPSTVQILDGTQPSNTPAVRSFEAPGTYAYSGGGYTVAQLLMVEASGKAFPELLRDSVLRPVGMRGATFSQPLPDALVPTSASGHDEKGAVIPGARNTYPEYAAAGLWTTPSDYGRFMIALQNSQAGRKGALLKLETAQAMLTPVDSGYGLGLGLAQWGGHPYFQHGGSNEGFQCNALAFLDGSRQGVVVMTNGESGGLLAAELVYTIAAAYGWGEQGPRTGSSRRAPFVASAAK